MPAAKIPGRSSEIDALRGIAVLFVMLAHFRALVAVNWHVYEIFKFEAGVPLFFAISGFVISGTLIPRLNEGKSSATIAGFYVRRAYRIFPLAYLWLGIGLLGAAYFNDHGSFGSYRTNLYGAAAAILNIANITQAKVLILGNGMFGAYWSLSLEEQFYLIFPLFLLLTPAKYRTHVVCLVLVGLAAVWRKSTGGFSLQDAFAIDPMLFGILVYLFGLRGLGVGKKGGQAIVVGLLFLLLAAPLPLLDSGVAYTLVGLLSGSLVLFAQSDRGFVPNPFGLLSWIGRRSYGLYLAHGPCIAYVLELQLDPISRTTVWLLLTFGITAFLYRYVEHPLIQAGRQRAKALERAHPTVSDVKSLDATVSPR